MKDCDICKRPFKPIRKTNRLCGDPKCVRKAKSIRTTVSRHLKQPLVQIRQVETESGYAVPRTTPSRKFTKLMRHVFYEARQGMAS